MSDNTNQKFVQEFPQRLEDVAPGTRIVNLTAKVQLVFVINEGDTEWWFEYYSGSITSRFFATDMDANDEEVIDMHESAF